MNRLMISAGVALLSALFASGVLAQSMSDEYVEARTEHKYAKPHGITFGVDLLGFGAYFENQVKVRDLGIPGDRISYHDHAGGSPIWIFGGVEAHVRWSWWDSVHIGYNLSYLRGFKSNLEDDRRYNGFVFPENVDMDFATDWHDVHAYYRRDIFRLGATKSMTFFGLAGLEWASIQMDIDSDDFPAGERSDESFRELLPWYTVGVGFEWQITRDILLHAQARGAYVAGMPTFQQRDDEPMKQSVTSIDARAGIEWAITPWLNLIARAKFRYMRVRLYGGGRQNNFLWFGYGPEVGLGFRF